MATVKHTPPIDNKTKKELKFKFEPKLENVVEYAISVTQADLERLQLEIDRLEVQIREKRLIKMGMDIRLKQLKVLSRGQWVPEGGEIG